MEELVWMVNIYLPLLINDHEILFNKVNHKTLTCTQIYGVKAHYEYRARAFLLR